MRLYICNDNGADFPSIITVEPFMPLPFPFKQHDKWVVVTEHVGTVAGTFDLGDPLNDADMRTVLSQQQSRALETALDEPQDSMAGDTVREAITAMLYHPSGARCFQPRPGWAERVWVDEDWVYIPVSTKRVK